MKRFHLILWFIIVAIFSYSLGECEAQRKMDAKIKDALAFMAVLKEAAERLVVARERITLPESNLIVKAQTLQTDADELLRHKRRHGL